MDPVDAESANTLTSREAQKARTKATLKQAALAAFAEKGYADASIADITRAARVAQGTFYVHFASKEAVLDELLADFNRGLIDAFGKLDLARLAAGGELRPLVDAVARTFLDYWAGQGPLVTLFAQRAAAGVRVEELRDGINPALHRFLVDLLVLRAGRGRERADLALVAHGVLALWLRMGMQSLLSDSMSAAQRRRLPRLLTDMTVGMLEAALPNAKGDTP